MSLNEETDAKHDRRIIIAFGTIRYTKGSIISDGWRDFGDLES